MLLAVAVWTLVAEAAVLVEVCQFLESLVLPLPLVQPLVPPDSKS
jgi:hypothetical protein